jgi:hypothetical protein
MNDKLDFRSTAVDQRVLDRVLRQERRIRRELTKRFEA